LSFLLCFPIGFIYFSWPTPFLFHVVLLFIILCYLSHHGHNSAIVYIEPR
jgi:hypothetical protein